MTAFFAVSFSFASGEERPSWLRVASFSLQKHGERIPSRRPRSLLFSLHETDSCSKLTALQKIFPA
jgi:hypothetical protein